MDSVGGRIRRARENAVLSQTELAVKSGITRTALTMIENGHEKPRPSTIRKIAGALGVPAAELVAQD